MESAQPAENLKFLFGKFPFFLRKILWCYYLDAI